MFRYNFLIRAAKTTESLVETHTETVHAEYYEEAVKKLTDKYHQIEKVTLVGMLQLPKPKE